MIFKFKDNFIIRLFIITCLLLTVVFDQLKVSAQDTIKLSALSLNACNGDTLHVPVYATNFNNIGSVGIKIKFDTVNLIPHGLQNINTGLSGSLYNISKGVCKFAWNTANNTPANIGNGKLFDLVYIYKGGMSFISFLPGCEIIDIKTYKAYKLGFANGIINDTSSYHIRGKVNYDNINSTPLKNIKLKLYNKVGQIIDSTLTDNTGLYSFNKLHCGNYTIKASTDKIAGGINPSDGLLILRSFVGLYTFRDKLKKKSADVNKDGNLNSSDALLINRRFVKLIKSFPSGDWLFNDVVLNVRNDISLNIKGICYGDTDGSYIPSK